jgi:uncharacterized protein YaaQ
LVPRRQRDATNLAATGLGLPDTVTTLIMRSDFQQSEFRIEALPAACRRLSQSRAPAGPIPDTLTPEATYGGPARDAAGN